MAENEIRLWYWTIPVDAYNPKRRKSTWRMTEEDARQRYGDAAEKVEGTLEVRHDVGHTSDMHRGLTAKDLGRPET